MGLFEKLFKRKSGGQTAPTTGNESTPRGIPAVEITACIIDAWDSRWGGGDYFLKSLSKRKLVLQMGDKSYEIPPTADISWLVTWPEGCARCGSEASDNIAYLIPCLKDPTQYPQSSVDQPGSRFGCGGFGWKVHVCSSCYRELSSDYAEMAKADGFVQLMRVSAPRLHFAFESAVYASKFKTANSSIYNPPSYWRPPRYVCSGCGSPVDISWANCSSCGLAQTAKALGT